MDVNLQPTGITTQGTYAPDNLIAGNFPIQTKSGVILSGSGVLKRGTILEVSGSPGKFRAVTVDANAKYVLAEDVDATAGDKTTIFYVTGAFNDTEVFYGVGGTLAGSRAALEPLSIFLVPVVSN
jgi:hypothetical protein